MLTRLIRSQTFENNRHLICGLALWLLLTFSAGAIPVLKELRKWQYRIRTLDSVELRMHLHDQYRHQKPLYDYVREATRDDTAVLVVEPDRLHSCLKKHFLPYFLAPRPVYKYSGEVVDKLNAEQQDFIVIEMICNKEEPVVWRLAGAFGNDISGLTGK